MIFFSYILYYCFLLPVSLLPFRVLYFISDIFCFIIFYIVPYRKKVVFANLKNSFPDKPEKEINAIAEKFYRHFCDIVFETIKSFTISEKEMRKRMIYKNPGFLEPYKSKSLIAITGHYNNWEWVAMASPFYLKHKTLGIYMPLSNKFFDKKIQTSRCRFGMEMFSVRETKDYFEKYNSPSPSLPVREGETTPVPTITGFVADQTPSNLTKCHWMNFLNQDTPVYLGAEKYATLYDYPVVFGKITKIKRGFYELEFVFISEKPQEEKEFAITERHTKFLEKQIMQKPEFWLWTHKRWKHKRSSNPR